MTPGQWQLVKELFEATLERGPAERSAFLAQACAGDEEIRREVESLLAAHEKDSTFMNKPAGNLGIGAKPMLETGQRFGDYEIISLIGEGGMGQVYLAMDTRLGRKVALKLLSSSYTDDANRVRRFEQEARAASALNHPNIVTIHEIGRTESLHFIATEFVDGETLRARMNLQMDVGGALDVAIQVTSALQVAHEARIVHRDIKPENVMLRRDRVVKVLDFGLAKLTSQTITEVDSHLPTQAMVQTKPGVVMGTVGYMSPEQARGEEVDPRTDLWSLGVVLYELIAGRSPFEGATASEVIAQILERQPPPLARYAREPPPELERIVNKGLTKDREERYQTAKDLLIDLRGLRRRLEIETELERFATPGADAAVTAGPLSTAGKTAEESASTQAVAAHPTSSAEYLITEIKRHKGQAIVIFAVVALLVAGGGFGVYKLLRQKQTGLSFQTAKFARLTSTGKAIGAAISPDGKWLVHVMDDGGQQSLWLRQVAVPNSNTQIVPTAEVQYWGLAFSPDGNYVYYTAREKDVGVGALYQVPVLGGTPRKLTTGINSSVAFSPDGKQIAFFAYFFGNEDRVMIANSDGTGQRQLAVRGGDEYFFWEAFSGVSWSPDGKTLATLIGHKNYMSVATISVASGETNHFTQQKWGRVGHVAWLGDGSSLLVTAQELDTDTFNIWQLSYPAGEAQKLTNDLNSYSHVSLTSDFKLLAAVQTERESNIWVLPAFDVASAIEITRGRNFVSQVSWSPAGKIIYSLNANGNFDLYSIDSNGGNGNQLVNSPGFDIDPCVSPDGRYVVFASDRLGTMHIWRSDIDGANAKQLTDKKDDEPSFSPDGRWVVYSSCPLKCNPWKVSIEGGPAVAITEKFMTSLAVSPDGKQIAGFFVEGNEPVKFAIVSFEDGQLIKTFARPTGVGKVRWSADGQALLYLLTRDGISNVWAQPSDGSPPRQLTNFTSERIFGFDISRDGKQLAVSRGTQASDVVLISDFK